MTDYQLAEWEILTGFGDQREEEVGAGLYVRVPQQVTLRGGGYTVRIELDLYPEGLRARAIEVEAEEGSDPVDGAVMRGLRFGELLQTAAPAILWAAGDDSETSREAVQAVDSTTGSARRPAPEVLSKRYTRPTDDALRAVADLHTLASRLGLGEHKFVEEHLGVSRSKAGYWIRLARERGFLAPSKRDG